MSSRQEKGKLQISASALVELKATLFSKQREVRSKEKPREETALATKTVSEKTSAIWRKVPKQQRRGRGNEGRVAVGRDTQRSAEEEAELERSRKALEAKAALYDRLCEGEGVRGGGSGSEGEEEEGRYMVDFTRKIVEERRAQQQSSSTTHKKDEEGEKEGVAMEEGEWVEYVDSFGRTRRCPKEDLPHMKRAEERMRERSPTPDLLSEDMARERERRRWEEEQTEELENPVGPVHYEGLRQGEVRSHGVGYYAFSKDEEKRSEQLDLLNKLRDQTLNQREKKLKLQEKRRAMMEARLAKVRERKQLKQPVVEDEVKTDDVTEQEKEMKGEKGGTEMQEGGRDEDPIASMIASELVRARERAEKGDDGERDRLPKKKPYVRPWDKGKVMDPIRKRKKELEDERLAEFAPPLSYCNTSVTSQPKQMKLDNTDLKSDEKDHLLPSTTNEDHSLPKPEQISQQDGTETNTTFHPPPVPPQQYQPMQQPFYSGPYPYPPCLQYGGPPMPPNFGPRPPSGPIPVYFPYFHPPPPPPGIPPPQP